MPRFCFDFLSRAARVAFSNTSRTPSLVLAEHSRYLWALIFFLSASPCHTSLVSTWWRRDLSPRRLPPREKRASG